ncbi:Thioredoxin-like [Chitinophaga jiangningensis]|uniref:Thioredoxin-like n=1 Tax=Chitinophaga jiangningensis TaxID=1419482 RepID=A0A1M7M6Z5_9BACT|nr:thioredoxin family protein [Chitinophaga jiangningensis]SHM86491.1 Thioredoxin-like [Chitinophaga jiangningensis]
MKNIRGKILLFCCVLFAGKALAQHGIRFDSLSFNALKAKAAQEKKLIFIDCYTSWCAPCKWMDMNVFTLPAVAEQYNQHFINARFDMEKGEGIALRKEYNVSSFPTYLFIDSKGKLVYRSGSRMTAEEFMAVGENANNPAKSVAALQQQYDNGKRDMQFMLDFYNVLQDNDRNKAEQLGQEIVATFPEQHMQSELGWKTIKTLARTENDRLGAYFMQHQQAFRSYARAGEIDTLATRMVTGLLYGYIREGKDEALMKRLDFFRKSPLEARRREGVLIETEYYLHNKRYSDFNKLANSALKGVLKNDADKLSFIARRSGYRGDVVAEVLPVSYAMAKRAVALQPEEYSTQSTLAQLCLSMKKKEEGLAAARKAYTLAGTTKIEGIVNKLIAQLEQL